MALQLSSQIISPMLFTSYLCSSMVPSAGESFLFLPRHTGISVLQSRRRPRANQEGSARAPRPRSQTLPDTARLCLICATYVLARPSAIPGPGLS